MTGMNDELGGIAACFAPHLFVGKRVLVSGASSGIGLAIARGFAEIGADVLATGSSDRKLAALAHNPGNAGLSFAQFDVRDAAATIALMDAQPRIDVLINAAGIAQGGLEYELEVFADTIDVNLTASMRTAMAARSKLAASSTSHRCCRSRLIRRFLHIQRARLDCWASLAHLLTASARKGSA